MKRRWAIVAADASPIGGLGLFIVEKMADSLSCRRESSRGIRSFSKSIPS